MLQDVVEQRSVSTLHGKARDGRNDGRQQLSRLLAEVVVEGAADSKETEMDLVTLSRGKHPLAVCNDGNSAGYYFKVGIDSYLCLTLSGLLIQMFFVLVCLYDVRSKFIQLGAQTI